MPQSVEGAWVFQEHDLTAALDHATQVRSPTTIKVMVPFRENKDNTLYCLRIALNNEYMKIIHSALFQRVRVTSIHQAQ